MKDKIIEYLDNLGLDFMKRYTNNNIIYDLNYIRIIIYNDVCIVISKTTELNQFIGINYI
jgi:hypothetical protein